MLCNYAFVNFESSHPVGDINRFVSSPQRPDRFRGPPSLLSGGYQW